MSKEIQKHIEVQELQELPNGWKIAKLNEIANVGHKVKEALLDKGTNIPFIPMSLIPEDEVFIRNWKIKPHNEIRSGTLVRNGDLLLAKITPSFENGKQGILKDLPQEWAYATTEVYPIWPKDTNILNMVFLAFYFKKANLRKKLASKMEGTTGRQRLPKSVLKSIFIPLPPLPEQKAIAYALCSIQEAKEATEKVISSLKELKKSLMKHLFTYGPVPINQKSQVRLKDTEVGQIPEHWEVVKLEEIVNIYDKKRIPLNSSQRKRMKGIYPYCGANGILDYINNYVFDGEFVLLAEDGGYWGKFQKSAYIMKGKFWVNNHAHIMQAIKGKSINAFLANILNYTDLTPYISGTTRGKLNQGVMKNIKLPLPPIEEQEKIAEILKAVDEKIEAEEKRKDALESLFKSLLNNLMTAKIRLPEEFIKKFEEESNELCK